MPNLFILAAIFLAPTVFASETATTPSALWTSFQNDSGAFLQKHTGKQITITAIVAETYISKYLTPVVGLVDKAGEGVKVKMTGNFYSAREDKIVIKQCQAN